MPKADLGFRRRGSELGEWDRDFEQRTHPSDHRDWVPSPHWNETQMLTYRGSLSGWYMAPSVIDAAPWKTKKEDRVAGVYVVQAQPSGMVKVGYSDQVATRVADLQVGSHETLKLLFVISARRAEERRIHDEISDYRVRGEWFTAAAIPVLKRISTTCRPGE